MNSIKQSFILCSSVFMLLSCGGAKEHEVTAEETDTTSSEIRDTVKVTVNDTTKFKFDFAWANIPSPASGVQDLALFGVPYDNTILNDPKNSLHYTTEYRKAINLGIYNIDMAYAMLNDRGQDVLQYMKNILFLSDELGLKSALSIMIGKRAEANINNKDSLFKILDEIFIKSDSYLKTNERLYTAALVFTGSWLESLYVTCITSDRVSEPKLKAKARRMLWEQRFHLGNLTGVLKDYSSKKECAELVKDLNVIHQDIMAVKQDKDIDDKKFQAIASKIYSLREKQVK